MNNINANELIKYLRDCWGGETMVDADGVIMTIEKFSVNNEDELYNTDLKKGDSITYSKPGIVTNTTYDVPFPYVTVATSFGKSEEVYLDDILSVTHRDKCNDSHTDTGEECKSVSTYTDSNNDTFLQEQPPVPFSCDCRSCLYKNLDSSSYPCNDCLHHCGTKEHYTQEK